MILFGPQTGSGAKRIGQPTALRWRSIRPALRRTTKRILCALVVLLSLPCGAETVYRWQDESGTIHYSDIAVEGAQAISVDPVPVTDMRLPVLPSNDRAEESASSPAEVKYTIEIITPHDGQSLWRDDRTLPVTVAVLPQLDVDSGHRLQISIDGRLHVPASTDSHFLLHNIDRGEHRIRAEVIARNGQVLAQSRPITVYHRQHSLGIPTPGATHPRM